MFIGTCGFGSTGSSVITDYLREYDSMCVMDRIEFNLAYCVDGLTDLEFHLMQPATRVSGSSCAIERFRYMILHKRKRYWMTKMHVTEEELRQITNDYLDDLTQVKWPSFQNIHNSVLKGFFGGRIFYFKILPFLEKRFDINYTGYPLTNTCLSVKPKDFYERSKAYTKEILERMGADFSKPVVLDQPFSGNNPAASMKFFDDAYAIVVDRDPRDLYCFAKTKLKGNHNRFMPTDSVQSFVKYYRALRDDQPYKEENPRVLRIQFESLVYDYDEATGRVREFLKLGENPAPKSVFDPALSINNTQVFVRFPQFAQDVAYIEKELPEYLFDFSKYQKPDLSGEMFFGHSPKNRGV